MTLAADPPRRRPRRVPWRLVIAVAALLGVGLAAAALLRRGGGTGEVPIVHADTRPVKEKPANPGGTETQFQDTMVYNQLGRAKQTAPAERVMPGPEAPLPRAAPLPEAPPPSPPDAPSLPVSPDLALPEPKTLALAAPVPPPATAPAVKPEPAKPALGIGDLAAAALAEAPAKPRPATPPTSGAGNLMQLGATRSEAAARAEWLRLQQRYHAELGGLGVRIEHADQGREAGQWRILAGPIGATKATAVCARLALDKVPCAAGAG